MVDVEKLVDTIRDQSNIIYNLYKKQELLHKRLAICLEKGENVHPGKVMTLMAKLDERYPTTIPPRAL